MMRIHPVPHEESGKAARSFVRGGSFADGAAKGIHGLEPGKTKGDAGIAQEEATG